MYCLFTKCLFTNSSNCKGKLKCHYDYKYLSRESKHYLTVWRSESQRGKECLWFLNYLVGAFNSDDHYIYYCGQEPLRRNGVAIIVNKRVQNTILGCSLKNDSMISVCFQGKPFNITVVQIYALTSNAEEAEVEWLSKDLQDLLELTPKKDVLFIMEDCNAKVGSQQIPGVTGKFGPGAQNEAGQRLTGFWQENALVIANILFQQHKRRLYTC